MQPRVVSRSEAIGALDKMQKEALGSGYSDEDLTDYSEYTNDALEAEICLSGYINEEELSAVADDT